MAQPRRPNATTAADVVPPLWRPRRFYHYRNLGILGGFAIVGVILIIVGFVTVPSEVPPAAPPSTGVVYPPGVTGASTALGRSSDPTPVPPVSLPQEGACAAVPSDKRAWLRSSLNTVLSHGTRVGGSWSAGYNKTRAFIARMADCSDAADPASQYWKLWSDTFKDAATPQGVVTFSNLIAEFNHPPLDASGKRTGYGLAGHIVLAAHWDSKYFADFEFLGACDSAMPVVMLLLMMRDIAASARAAGVRADVYNPALPAYTIMFFDGEEAFVEWQGNDNTYGSRHLASVYQSRGDIAMISLFVLLDLLGPANPAFHNYFAASTGAHYQRLRGIEVGLRSANRLRRPPTSPQMFLNEASYSQQIADDHLPWLALGVPVLHIIPVPFPSSWHNLYDDGSQVDDDTAADLYDVISRFALTFNASAVRRR